MSELWMDFSLVLLPDKLKRDKTSIFSLAILCEYSRHANTHYPDIFKKLGMKAEEADIYKTGYNQNADHNLAPFQFK